MNGDICLNPKKSRNLFFGKRRENLCKLRLNDNEIGWAVDVVSRAIQLLCQRKAQKVLSALIHATADWYSLYLYSDVRNRGDNREISRQLRVACKLRVAYKSDFRRIFDYRSYRSAMILQTFLDRPTWEDLVDDRARKHDQKILSDPFLSSIFSR